MKKYLIPLSVAALLLLSCSSDGDHKKTAQYFNYHKSIKGAGFSRERLARIDTFMNKMVNEGVLPNAVTFVARQGVVVHHKAYGWKNIEQKIPLRKNDIYRIASQTKAVTSVALMILYEEGRFLLDDPVSKYIPEFRNMVVLDTFNLRDTSYTTRPAKRQITIRQLLTHTSGIHYGVLGGGPGNNIYAKNGIPAVCSLDSLTIEQLVKRMSGLPLMFDPGEKYLYGMNLDVAGYLIEVLSGKQLDVFMKERIFEPLGMNDTYFYLPDDKAERLVTLYSSSPDGLKVNRNRTYQSFPVSGAKMLFLGGAGLCGTIEDYAKFCQMILNKGTFNGQRILGRKTVDIMTVNQIGDKILDGPGEKFGLGFRIFEKESIGKELVSEGALKWGGMYATDYLIDPKEDMIRLVYTNVQPYSGPVIYSIFNNLVYQALE
jgi:CubicO group peptidase (beta-lactamase class C family)